MKDLKLTGDGDLDTSGHGITLIDGAERVGQQVRTCLRVFFGEWEFDLDQGVPWFQTILAHKETSLNDVDNRLRAAILGVTDVLSVLSFSMNFNRNTRILTIIAKINTTFGVIVVEGSFP